MVINKVNDKRVTGTVVDPDIKKDYTGVATETAVVDIDEKTKEISVNVITEGLLDWGGEDAKKAYPAPLGRDALIRADMALIGIRDEEERAKQAEEQLEFLIKETEESISVGDGKNLLKIQAETERAKAAEDELDKRISNSSTTFDNFVSDVDKRFKETSENIDETKLDLQAEIRQTKDDLFDEIYETAQTFDNKIKQVTADHNKFEQFVSDTYSTKAELSALDNKVNKSQTETDKKIESLRTDVETQISIVENELSTELQATSQTLADNIEKLTLDQTKFQNYVSETYSTKAQLSELDKKVTDNKLSTNLQIDSLKSEIKDSFDVTNKNLATVEQRVSDVESTYATKDYVYNEVHSAITLSKQLVEDVDLVNNTVTIQNNVVTPVAGVLYMLKDFDANVSDIYKEYTVVEGQLTLIGDTSISLDGYATEQWVKDQKYLTSHQDLSEYAKTKYVEEQINHVVTYVEESIDAIPEVDLTPYAKSTDIPTKVSQLENDKGYLTQHQSLADYATKDYVDKADNNSEQELNNVKNYITDIIDPAIENKSDKGHKHTLVEITDYAAPDLSDYAKKSDIPDVSAFIAEIPAEYITEEELDEKGYYDESAVTNLLSSIKFIDGGTSASILK